MANEVRWIPGYDGYYKAVSDGSIISVGRFGRRGDRVLTPTRHKRSGYYRVCLRANGKQRTVSVHILVALAFLGSRPPGAEVNHKNCDKSDNSAMNLEYVSRTENQRHAEAAGVMNHAVGERHWRAKLTANDVVDIRRRSATERQIDLAKEYGVSATAIMYVVKRKNWKSVPLPTGDLCHAGG